jgi:P63C domain-containing protein
MELTEKEKMAAKAFARMGGLKGGPARAEAMTPEERSENARQAAEARWAKRIESAEVLKTISAGLLEIGDIKIPCAVLEDPSDPSGTPIRVLTQRGFFVALGRHKNPTRGQASIDNQPAFLAAKNIQRFIHEDLRRSWTPIYFESKGGYGGNVAFGYRAELLPQVCNVWLAAQDAGVLFPSQEHIAEKCKILVRGFAVVGIVALIDEATGFQDNRARNALAKILEQFIAKELQPYVTTFPLDFFKEMCRLRDIPFPSNMKLPRYFGKLVNNLTYCRLAPGVLEELQIKNPPGANGRRKNKNYRWLTEHIGYQKLLMLLGSEITLMRDSKNWEDFEVRINKHHPRYRPLPLFDNIGIAQE